MTKEAAAASDRPALDEQQVRDILRQVIDPEVGRDIVSLGFVFSMIFGHAPIIFPAVVRVKIPYHPFFYVPLLVLHASLALRILGGLGDAFPLRREGGLLNAVALLLFIVTMIASVVRGKRDDHGAAQ